jgi:hypothetical protein
MLAARTAHQRIPERSVHRHWNPRRLCTIAPDWPGSAGTSAGVTIIEITHTLKISVRSV